MTEQNTSEGTAVPKIRAIINTAGIQLDTFKISTIGEPRMYANGYQQCKIEIQAEKQVYNDATGRWETKPLTSAEIQSIKIASYSSNMYAPLPHGWLQDTEYNGVDFGFIPGSMDAGETISENLDSKEGAKVSNYDMSLLENETASYEVMNRYLRCSSSAAIQPEKLMATIQLENGVTHSTHSVANQSFVIITPVRPYRIAVKDLLNPREVDIGIETRSIIGGFAYYWQFPHNLTIKGYGFSGEYPSTPKLMPCLKENNGLFIIGAIILMNVTSLSARDFFPNFPDNPRIPLEGNDNYIRAMYLLGLPFGKETILLDPKRVEAKYLDNFGCEHKFIFECSAKGFLLFDA